MSSRLFGRLSRDAKGLWSEVEHDVAHYAASKDPWAAREEWRRAPEFSPRAAHRILFDGWLWGAAAFVAFCAAEGAWKWRRRQLAHSQTQSNQH